MGLLDDAMIEENRAYKQADYGRRLAAYVVDALILMIPSFFLALIFGDAIPDDLYNVVLYTFYGTYFESSKTQATLGKQMLGLKVLRKNREPLSVGLAFKRNLIKYISWVLFFLTIPYTFFINKNRQTPYDQSLQIMVTTDEE